jgi:hypothetical protein
VRVVVVDSWSGRCDFVGDGVRRALAVGGFGQSGDAADAATFRLLTNPFS